MWGNEQRWLLCCLTEDCFPQRNWFLVDSAQPRKIKSVPLIFLQVRFQVLVNKLLNNNNKKDCMCITPWRAHWEARLSGEESGSRSLGQVRITGCCHGLGCCSDHTNEVAQKNWDVRRAWPGLDEDNIIVWYCRCFLDCWTLPVQIDKLCKCKLDL